MTTKILVDLRFGDCGKARIVDFIAPEYDINARFSGGSNSGHVIYINEIKTVLHSIPSGIMRPNIQCIIGNGCVVNPNSFMDEVEELKSKGIDVEGRLFVSDRAHVTLPWHITQDDVQGVIGSTKKGIGPTYASKVSRDGLRTGEISEVLPTLQEADKIELERALDRGFEKYLTDTSDFLWINRDKNILCEGSQGTMLDIDHGTYPFVTSSNAVAGGACTGLGISPMRINGVIGVFKAYDTRVGNGPFITRMEKEPEEFVQTKGNEFGSTTGRPRQCGWLDLVALRYACRINGVTELAITKLDVLNGLKDIKVCTAYVDENTNPLTTVPASAKVYGGLGKMYAFFPGWDGVTGQTKLEDLPTEARAFLDQISDFLEIPFKYISTGRDREEMIVL